MSPLLTTDELEREILYLREQNQKILRELSKVIEENAALRETRPIRVKRPTKGHRTIGGKETGAGVEQKENLPKGEFLRTGISLN